MYERIERRTTSASRLSLAVAVALALLALLWSGCAGTPVQTTPTTLPRPTWPEPSDALLRGWYEDPVGDYVIPARELDAWLLAVRVHVAELHAAPWWRGEPPPWVREAWGETLSADPRVGALLYPPPKISQIPTYLARD